MMNAKARLFAAALLLAGLNLPSQAEPYEKLSGQISDIARRTGYRRLAVMPLQPVAGGASHSGEVLAARLISLLSARPEVEVVERALLDQVLEEQGLGYKGVIQADQAKAVGKVLGVDAIVTGTYLQLHRGQLEVHVRLIDTETARILGAVTADVEKEWEESFLASANVWDTPPPAIRGLGQARAGVLPDMRDALADTAPCGGWEERIRTLQRDTLDLRARYWAARLREPGFHASALTRNPGSDIRDLEVRREFYRRTAELHNDFYRDGVTTREKERLDAADRQVQRVLNECYYK